MTEEDGGFRSRRDAELARIEDVGHRYGKVVALEGITLSLPAGRLIGLIGPDGAGKSSFLAIVVVSANLARIVPADTMTVHTKKRRAAMRK